jgi:hypothetical protein
MAEQAGAGFKKNRISERMFSKTGFTGQQRTQTIEFSAD